MQTMVCWTICVASRQAAEMNRLAACAPQKDVVPYPLHVREFGGSFTAHESFCRNQSRAHNFSFSRKHQRPVSFRQTSIHLRRHDEAQTRRRAGAVAGWKMGGVRLRKMSIWRRTQKFRIYGSCRRRGGESRRLNPTPNHEERPRFSPDGKRLIWTSKATDPTQIWMCDFDPSAGALVGQPHQVTNISTGADGAIWSPDGKKYRVRVGGISGLQG